MREQKFLVILRVKTKTSITYKMTEAKVKAQLAKLLKKESLLHGIPTAGTCDVVIKEVVEDTK